MVLLTQQMAVLGTVFVPPNVRQDSIISLRGYVQVLMGEASCYLRGEDKAHIWFVSGLVENARMTL